MLSKKNAIISLAMNCIIVIATIGVVISYFCGNDGQYNIPPSFRFFLYTTDSNILCMLTAAIMLFFEIRYLKTGKEIPKLAVILKFVGVTALSLTFAVVMLFLGPTMGFMDMVFGGTSVYMHFAGPILGFVTFCLTENIHIISKKVLIPAIMPAVAYGVAYTTMVVFIGSENGGWIDFYGFNTGGFWYISCVVIILATLGLGAVLRLIHNKAAKKTTK